MRRCGLGRWPSLGFRGKIRSWTKGVEDTRSGSRPGWEIVCENASSISICKLTRKTKERKGERDGGGEVEMREGVVESFGMTIPGSDREPIKGASLLTRVKYP